MSIAFTTTSIEVINGCVTLRGTVDITDSEAGGEEVTPNDIESGLGSVELLQIEQSGDIAFSVSRPEADRVIIKPIDVTAGLTVESGFTDTGLAFYCRGCLT